MSEVSRLRTVVAELIAEYLTLKSVADVLIIVPRELSRGNLGINPGFARVRHQANHFSRNRDRYKTGSYLQRGQCREGSYRLIPKTPFRGHS